MTSWSYIGGCVHGRVSQKGLRQLRRNRRAGGGRLWNTVVMPCLAPTRSQNRLAPATCLWRLPVPPSPPRRRCSQGPPCALLARGPPRSAPLPPSTHAWMLHRRTIECERTLAALGVFDFERAARPMTSRLLHRCIFGHWPAPAVSMSPCLQAHGKSLCGAAGAYLGYCWMPAGLASEPRTASDTSARHGSHTAPRAPPWPR